MQQFITDTYKLTGLKLTPRQITQFERYEQELLDWNQRFNLTAIREPEAIRTKHFLDSLTPYLDMQNPLPLSMIDVGTGAGFPGIPLKIVIPSMRLTLVESVGKKATFCQHMVDTLSLENVKVLTTRAEDLGQNRAHRERYDWAVARAVASLPVLAEYLLPLVKIGGAMLAQKGENARAEVQAAENAFRMLGGSLRKVSNITLPGVVEERHLVIVDKKAATPSRFPRRAGVPAKNPL